MRILVIDDERDIVDVISGFLAGGTHLVEGTTDARTGVSWLESGDFDVVITDVLLPEVDGIEITRLVRRRFPELWVVAISGGTSRFPGTTALRLAELSGADRILHKPFSRAELLEAVEAKGRQRISA